MIVKMDDALKEEEQSLHCRASALRREKAEKKLEKNAIWTYVLPDGTLKVKTAANSAWKHAMKHVFRLPNMKVAFIVLEMTKSLVGEYL